MKYKKTMLMVTTKICQFILYWFSHLHATQTPQKVLHYFFWHKKLFTSTTISTALNFQRPNTPFSSWNWTLKHKLKYIFLVNHKHSLAVWSEFHVWIICGPVFVVLIYKLISVCTPLEDFLIILYISRIYDKLKSEERSIPLFAKQLNTLSLSQSHTHTDRSRNTERVGFCIEGTWTQLPHFFWFQLLYCCF